MHTVTVSRVVPAAPEQVFDAWTDAERLAAWWWPQLAGTTYDVDARVGGGYRIESPVLGVVLHGEYTEVDAPRRLAFTWNWLEGCIAELPERVEVSFDDSDDDGDGTTLVTVVHRCAEGLEGRLRQGWSDVLDRLVRRHQESTSPRS